MGFGLDAAALNRRKQALERAQQAVNQAVLELCGPYMPRDTGALIRSGGVQGKAAVGWSSPYAAAQYQATAGGPGTRVRSAGPGTPIAGGRGAGAGAGGERGGQWFERMKAAHLDEIVDRAAKAAGGRSG